MIIKSKAQHDAIKYLNETDHELYKLLERILTDNMPMTDAEKELLTKRAAARATLQAYKTAQS